MGYFTIELPDAGMAEVRTGRIIRKSLNIFHLFRRKEIRIGYMVKIGERECCRLLRTKEGQWLKEGNAGFQPTEEDEISIALKKAIEVYEHRQR
jgi:hypothetical protein